MGGEVAGAERAGMEIAPLTVDRRDEETPLWLQHSTTLLQELVGSRQVVYGLVEEDHVETGGRERQDVSVETNQRDPPPVVCLRLLNEVGGVIAADDTPCLPLQIPEALSCSAGDIEDVLPLAQPRR